ncbi:rCG26118, isoform CRA_b [Rattus norvegicus]|uniref:RCG26118, isoform CRA_b n=1 Tax=Rattus norvegicus TaxID=10116 RepID=A6HQ73_RAT|nr:rCG26118, isoform CRA_b [Rattus norvegicus]
MSALIFAQHYVSSSEETWTLFPRVRLPQTCLFVMLFMESYWSVWFPFQGSLPGKCALRGPRLILVLLSSLPVSQKAVHSPFFFLWPMKLVYNKLRDCYTYT